MLLLRFWVPYSTENSQTLKIPQVLGTESCQLPGVSQGQLWPERVLGIHTSPDWVQWLKIAQWSSLRFLPGKDTGFFLYLLNQVWGWAAKQPTGTASETVLTRGFCHGLLMGEEINLITADFALPAIKEGEKCIQCKILGNLNSLLNLFWDVVKDRQAHKDVPVPLPTSG